MIRTVMANRRLMLSVREKRCYYKFLNDEKMARAKSRSLEEKLVEMNDLCEQAQLHFQWFRGQSRYINVKDVTSDKVYFNPSQIANRVVCGFRKSGIDCVVGGSLAVMVYTLPQMTKNVDFNIVVSLKDPNAEAILRNVCAKSGWKFVRLIKMHHPSAAHTKVQDVFTVGLASIVVDGVRCDVFLNDWEPTEYVHAHAQEVAFPSDPPSSLKLAPPEAIAFFKIVTLSEKSKRPEKDIDHVKQLLRLCPDFDRAWVRHQLVRHLGESALPVQRFDSWLQEVDTEEDEELPETLPVASTVDPSPTSPRSEEVTPEDTAGDVVVLKGKSFAELVLDNDKDVLVEFYAPWCGQCQMLSPVWDELGAHYKDNPNVVIAKMDATANAIPLPGVAVHMFPTLYFFKGGDKTNPVKYEQDYELDDLVSFVDENSHHFACDK